MPLAKTMITQLIDNAYPSNRSLSVHHRIKMRNIHNSIYLTGTASTEIHMYPLKSQLPDMITINTRCQRPGSSGDNWDQWIIFNAIILKLFSPLTKWTPFIIIIIIIIIIVYVPWCQGGLESLVGRAVQGCCVVHVVVVVVPSFCVGWLWSWSKMHLMLVAVVFRLLVLLENISLLYTLNSPTSQVEDLAFF